VTARLGFTCSAGIAANKLLAKLCGGLHKPDQQTVLPLSHVSSLLSPLPTDRLRGFGGKLGELLRAGRPELGLAGFETAGALVAAGAPAVARVLRGEWTHPEETAEEACRLAAGKDDDQVKERPLAKQIGSSKNFGGRRGSARGPLDTKAQLQQWVAELSEDVGTRIAEDAAENDRWPSCIIASCKFDDTSHRSKCAHPQPAAATDASPTISPRSQPTLSHAHPPALRRTFAPTAPKARRRPLAGACPSARHPQTRLTSPLRSHATASPSYSPSRTAAHSPG
jgi:nucleotidyltransferase/DNA polymerase involved in DNA repair